MKTAIITGIGGQDGAYLAHYLLSIGYKVIGTTRSISQFNNYGLQYLNILDSVELVRLNDPNESAISDLLFKYQPTEVYNLAAQSSVSHSFSNPFETIQYNILSTLAWVKVISDHYKHVRFYQASSSEMFGNISPEDLPIRENKIFHPASPYGISKATSHWITVNFRETYQLFLSNGILFNHESVLRGKGFVIKKIISHLVYVYLEKANTQLKIGNKYIKRDWGYAPEYVKVMHKIANHTTSEDFLICSGNVMSLDQFIDLVCEKLDLDKERFIVEDKNLFRPNDLMEIYGDPSKAKNILNWEYNMSNQDLVHKLIEDEIKYYSWQKSFNINARYTFS